MKMYSALYRIEHDPFGIVDEQPIAVRKPEDIPNDAKGFLLLHGGEDISPSIYGEQTNKYCRAPNEPSQRDQLELDLIKRARELDLVILGICRGAQLLCAVDGGKLVQHIVGHGNKDHTVSSPEYGDVIGKSNTAHHQMMVPRSSRMNTILGVVNEKVLGYSELNTLREYDRVPEIVVFNKLKGFGVQFHPEWMNPTDTIVNWCKNYILNNLVRT